MSSSLDIRVDTDDAARAFVALADPTRRRILGVLVDVDECSAGDVSDRITGMCRTAVSTHLRVLLTARLVRERRAGRHRYYSLDADGPAREVLTVLHGYFGTGSPAVTP